MGTQASIHFPFKKLIFDKSIQNLRKNRLSFLVLSNFIWFCYFCQIFCCHIYIYIYHTYIIHTYIYIYDISNDTYIYIYIYIYDITTDTYIDIYIYIYIYIFWYETCKIRNIFCDFVLHCFYWNVFFLRIQLRLIIAIVIRCSRLRLGVGYFTYFWNYTCVLLMDIL